MTPKRIDIFFYGLFMDTETLRSKGVQPVNPRLVSVPGFALRIGQRATLVPDPDSRVYGVLMQLSHFEIEQLYADASVQMYRPEAVIAELENAAPVPALCFNLPEPPGPDEANQQYAQKLRDLARRLGLPAHYVDRIA
ncbi:gamma-glutamylcyclotransferase [bacterium]|nr:gamma-glutamylcyclotransferase [bacterium]MCI0604658.1 gamma-glutamylcyclotransferase [bacterium]